MKIEFVGLWFLLLSNTKIYSQEVLDTANLMCTYKLVYLIDSSNRNRTSTDILHLVIGKRYSNFFSYITYAADSAFKADIGIGEGKISPEQLMSNKAIQKKYTNGGEYSLYNLYIDNRDNKITITDKIIATNYIYEEKKEQINWTVLPDTLTILNYKCQKATASFRGRIYNAWFTSELPISSGPYKFNGLPGLIIKIADTNNNFSFQCLGIEQLTDHTHLITINSKGCVQTTRSAFRKAFRASFENPWELISTNVDVTIGGRDVDKIKEMLQRGIPYNPIELQ